MTNIDCDELDCELAKRKIKNEEERKRERLFGDELESWIRQRLDRVNEIRISKHCSAISLEDAILYFSYFTRANRDELDQRILLKG